MHRLHYKTPYRGHTLLSSGLLRSVPLTCIPIVEKYTRFLKVVDTQPFKTFAQSFGRHGSSFPLPCSFSLSLKRLYGNPPLSPTLPVYHLTRFLSPQPACERVTSIQLTMFDRA